jgi:D-alanyl-lipoteichoic acid acyltransferase DltB (MBOAT superfamily)
MLFNSHLFLFLFLPATLAGFALLGRYGRRPAIGWLALTSILFYARWNPRFVVVLLGSMLVNFTVSRFIAMEAKRPRRQSAWLAAGIAANLGALAYFKYLFPLLRFLTQAGIGHHQWADAVLPLGISFFTFTQIAYLIDLKQGEAEPQGLISFSLFVTFFPHLIAGPILHHKEMMPQFAKEKRYRLDLDDMAVGVTWFILGLCKKVLIADLMAPHANAAFADPAHQTAATAWLGALNYLMQLYFDFSGYSDMAIGLARMFSIRFPFNFNSPYKAASVIEFWQRWHMTLTRYITLYLYNPISLAVTRRRLAAGKKVSSKASKTPEGFLAMIAYPTVVTMFLAGVWHGAGFQFLIFGLIHGVCMTAEHAWNLFHPNRQRQGFRHAASVLRVNLTVMAAFIFFRSQSTGAALELLRGMLGLHGHATASFDPASLMVLGLFPVVWFLPNTQEILGETGDAAAARPRIAWRPSPVWGLVLAGAFLLCLAYLNGAKTFLYFQF